MDKLTVENLVLGQLGTNGYLVMNRETGEMLVIDPAAEADCIRRKAEEMGGKPAAVFLTHGHYDHIGAVREICAAYQIPCWAMEAERELLASTDLNLSRMFGHPMTLVPDENLRDGQELTMAGRKMLVLGTPGHTAGGVCILIGDALFTGDTLFPGACGRVDLPSSDPREMRKSLYRLSQLPDDTQIFAGHSYGGKSGSFISYERQTNPFMRNAIKDKDIL